MKIIMTGGGSAGHVTPNLALIPHLRGKGWQIGYIGGDTGMERGLIEIAGVGYHGISTGKLRRYLDIKNFTDPFRVLRGFTQALSILRDEKPDVVFSKGGFVSVPVVYAAAVRGIPVVAHESDMTPGLANKLVQPFVRVFCTTFPETAGKLKRGVHTGTPLRQELFLGDRARGLHAFALEGKKPVLMMTGGALGRLLQAFDIIHLCGKGNYDTSLEFQPGYRQVGYLGEGMHDAFAAADIVLSRAGSNSLCELLALKKPHLLVPYPKGGTSRGDQVENALSFERRGFSRVLMQQDMTPEKLTEEILRTWKDRKYFIERMAKEPSGEGTQAVLREIEKVVKL